MKVELRNIKQNENLMLFAIAFVVITLFSKCSFIYPVNDWVDANAYFTVGKGILKGMVPYRDLFDHKGPWLFFIQAIGALISYKSFFGIYCIEIIAAFVFLRYSLKTVRLFSEPKYPIISVAFLAVVVYSSFCFYKGDSVEEFALPMLTYSLYMLLKYAANDIIPSWKESIVLGILIGVVFWMKYTVLGFYVGAISIVTFFMFIDKRYNDYFRSCAFIMIGFIIASLVPVLYFLFNNALSDLIEVYFIANIFHYNNPATAGSIAENLFGSNSAQLVLENPVLFIAICISLFQIITFHRARVTILFATCLLITYFFVFFAHTYPYYIIQLCVFVSFVIIPFEKCFEQNKKMILVCFCTFCFVLIILNKNVQTLIFKQDKWILEMKAGIDKKNVVSIFNYSTGDIGLNTLLGTMPTVKYFYKPNIKNDVITEEQTKYIEESKVDYFVSSRIVDFENYELVMQSYGVRPVTSYIKERWYKMIDEEYDYSNDFLPYFQYYLYKKTVD